MPGQNQVANQGKQVQGEDGEGRNREGQQNLRPGSHLSSLALEASDSLLSPLGSHLERRVLLSRSVLVSDGSWVRAREGADGVSGGERRFCDCRGVCLLRVALGEKEGHCVHRGRRRGGLG
jgi:hypothetical protein